MTIFSQRLAVISQQPSSLLGIGRGIERETLRVNAHGSLSKKAHPIVLGSALTHQWITTDFSEQLLEFITPVSHKVSDTLNQLYDIHAFTYRNLDDEFLWPFSMPSYVKNENDILLADYGSSNIGQMKTLYRKGLKLRYGSMMQIISGVHFNFSFSLDFWQALYPTHSNEALQAAISDGYFGVIRNYYRFGWLIPYFFGASPALCESFLKEKKVPFAFEALNDARFLPEATSLRLSDLGYTNSAQRALKIGFDSLEQYLDGLYEAIRTPSEEFAELGIKDEESFRQLNANVLQIENELYAPIRPKRVARLGEKPSEALVRGGVEYLEIRSLDVNPYSPIGITAQQVAFLDLFITWCALSVSDPISNCEIACWQQNWRKVVLQGRKKGLMLQIGCDGEQMTLQQWGQQVFKEMHALAEVMDKAFGGDTYQAVCAELNTWLDDPEKTISANVLRDIKYHGGLLAVGNSIAREHKQRVVQSQPLDFPHYSMISTQALMTESCESLAKQKQIEASDDVPLDQYLAKYFSDIV